MSFISIDVILFIAFLLFNVIVGLLAGRRVKTLRDFSVGNKDFSTATVTSTIVATWFGGGFMFYGLQNIYTHGLLFFIPLLGSSICLLFTGQVLAIRMGEFLNNLSVAEAMGQLYGRNVRVITATSGILVSIGNMAMQFKVIGRILTFLFNFEGPWVTITAASIVILYSAFGGIRSVLITDVLQFLVFSIFIPILALVVWKHLENPGQVTYTLSTHPIFNLRNIIGWNPEFLSALGLMLYFIIPGMNPPIFQRIVMAKDLGQVTKSFTYAAGLDFLITISITWIAILLLADNPGLDSNSLVNYIITTYAYPGLRGLIAIGISAMAMSTADSFLNSSAVLAVNDIIKPLRLSWISWQDSLAFVRILSLVFGGLALLLAIHTTDLLELLLLTSSFYMPIFTVPLLLAIFGFRSTTRSVLIGMGAGFITVVLWDKLFGYTGINKLIPGMLTNLISLMGSHYVLREQGGWVGIRDKGPLLVARQARRETWQHFINNIKNTKIYNYLQENLPTYEVIYSLLGIYIMGANYASLYTIKEDTITHYQSLYDFIYRSVLFFMAAFITYPAWQPTLKYKRRFITIAWPVGIFYVLFVVGSIVVLMSGFNELQVMIFMVNLIMTAFLLPWPLMLFLSFLGTIVGCLIFYMYCGDLYACISESGSGKFKFTYAALLMSSFLISIFRFKEKQKKLENKNTYLVTLYEDLYKEKNNELAEILDYREEVLKALSTDEKALLDHTTATYLQQIIYRLTEYMRLNVTQINLDQLLSEIKENIKLTDLPTPPQLIIKNDEKVESISVDAKKLKQLLTNGILHVHQHNPTNQPILIIVEYAKLGHKVDYINDYTRELKAVKFIITIEKVVPKTRDIYMLDELPLISKYSKKGSLLESARIIHAHYGYAKLDNEHTQVYVLPVNVREVRGKVMELLREPTIADPEELNHPLAIQLEKELLDKIKKEKLNVKVITDALDTIKRYHAGVKRKSGEPFFTHPIQVALILLGYCKDQDAVVAALLHDTVEDTNLSLVQIKMMFGEQVAFIVNKVTNLEDNLRRVSSEEHENIYRLIDYGDKRAAYVKLADRMHNMRTIEGHSSLDKQKSIADETLKFFVKLAAELGLEDIAEELKKRSMDVLGKKK